MISRVARVAVVLALLGLVLTLSLSFRRDPHDIRTGTVGKAAPDFSLERLDGSGRISLSDYAGKVVVLNFWASWCPPCKVENPALVRVWERYRGSDVVILGVLFYDSVEKGRDYVARMGAVWPQVVDDNGFAALSYGVFIPPETYFIAPDGVIAGRHIGAIDEATLVRGIETLRAAAAR